MGYRTNVIPNYFCKSDCEFMKLKADATKFANVKNDKISYSAQVNVICEYENICKMWNETVEEKLEENIKLKESVKSVSKENLRKLVDDLQNEFNALSTKYDLKNSLIRLCQKHDMYFSISLFDATNRSPYVDASNLVRYYMKNLNLVQYKGKQKFSDSNF